MSSSKKRKTNDNQCLVAWFDRCADRRSKDCDAQLLISETGLANISDIMHDGPDSLFPKAIALTHRSSLEDMNEPADENHV